MVCYKEVVDFKYGGDGKISVRYNVDWCSCALAKTAMAVARVNMVFRIDIGRMAILKAAVMNATVLKYHLNENHSSMGHLSNDEVDQNELFSGKPRCAICKLVFSPLS